VGSVRLQVEIQPVQYVMKTNEKLNQKMQTYSVQTELEKQLLQCHKEVKFWSKVFIVVILAVGSLSLYLVSDTHILQNLLR
jgi:hypothetical protein